MTTKMILLNQNYNIVSGLNYSKRLLSFSQGEQFIHIVEYSQVNNQLTLLISKMSEALKPNIEGNHIGEGGTFEDIIIHQPGIRFIINGGFSHYRKNFYTWKNQDFNVGDPVGLVKIRNHYFEDLLDINYYGFLVQESKNSKWKITNKIQKSEKYILGCTPLLILNGDAVNINTEIMNPIIGEINPPSVLGHGRFAHPRTAVGEKDGVIYFVIVEGTNNKGCTLLELQELGLQLGFKNFLNLDGGGSSQFRVYTKDNIIKNNVSKDDEKRVLGHSLIIFDETLK